ncbi:hypothetical protein IQ244_14855 [Nostoc sp. LEGE 06077]|uniref:hypothetical protein n=1 Tax=Nostoc sp. LEGE 06077 TaxID=915325 RepID=UPI00187F5E0B|nr:hypothetical protein [Nostoc sp. LEGE 06077]MBE9207774.1 hypothetical protein [Nostoc sp. LEGE 06077]
MTDEFRCYNFGFRGNFYTNWIWISQHIPGKLILILSFWTLSGANSQAAQTYQSLALLSGLKEQVNSISKSEENDEIRLLKQLDTAPILIAAPENFNPGLRVPPPLPPKPSPPPVSTPSEPVKPFAVLEGIQTNFRNDTDNFGQRNLFIEPTFQWRSPNGNKIFFKTGFDFFEQRGVESVSNIPLQIGWQGKIGQITLQTAAGVDVFDRLPTAINFHTKVEIPIVPPKVSSTGKLLSGLTISANLDQSPYKFNALTLDNQITAWRFGPDLYWQINRDTSLFSSLRLGNYNDGNAEIQSFSRLERKLGQFSLVANLFNWSYDRNVETTNGYFSPPDFLVYNAEVAWEGEITSFLRCRLSATVGQQRLNGEFDNAYGYESRCTAKLSPQLEADLDYGFTNVRNQNTGGSAYSGNSFTGQLRVKF